MAGHKGDLPDNFEEILDRVEEKYNYGTRRFVLCIMQLEACCDAIEDLFNKGL